MEHKWCNVFYITRVLLGLLQLQKLFLHDMTGYGTKIVDGIPLAAKMLPEMLIPPVFKDDSHSVSWVTWAFENQTAFALLQKDISLLAVTAETPQENVSTVSNLHMGPIPLQWHPQFWGGELPLQMKLRFV